MRGELSRFRQYWLAVFIICLLDITHREAGVLTVGATCVPDLGCQTLAYYRVQAGDNLQVLNGRFQITNADVQAYNPNVSDINLILAGTTLYLPFHCDCMNGILLHHFSYVVSEQLPALLFVCVCVRVAQMALIPLHLFHFTLRGRSSIAIILHMHTV